MSDNTDLSRAVEAAAMMAAYQSTQRRPDGETWGEFVRPLVEAAAPHIAAAAWDEGLQAGQDRWADAREFGDPPVNPYRDRIGGDA